jgi:hypothetical protein
MQHHEVTRDEQGQAEGRPPGGPSDVNSCHAGGQKHGLHRDQEGQEPLACGTIDLEPQPSELPAEEAHEAPRGAAKLGPRRFRKRALGLGHEARAPAGQLMRPERARGSARPRDRG